LSGGDALYRFVALVPHANARAEFNRYRRESALIAGKGIYTFPAAAPVALLTAPVPGDQLKRLAALFRLQSYKNGGDGRIVTGEISSIILPDGKTLAGPCLSIEAPPIPGEIAVAESFKKLILVAGIFPGTPELPPLRRPVKFSAAALANISLTPLRYEQSYCWTVGEPRWLPSIRGGAGFEH
jgi:hypothetical protein